MNSQGFGSILIVYGLLLVSVRLLYRQRTLYLYRNGVVAMARVRFVERMRNGKGDDLFYQTDVRFQLENGDNKHERLTLKEQYRKGEEVMVVYNPKKPSRLETYSEKVPDGGAFALGRKAWFIVGAFVLAGVGFIIYPLVS